MHGLPTFAHISRHLYPAVHHLATSPVACLPARASPSTFLIPSRPACRSSTPPPNFVGVPPGAGPGEQVVLRVASTLYDVMRPAVLFDALGSELKELRLVLALDMHART
jgi:hypothetical protein